MKKHFFALALIGLLVACGSTPDATPAPAPAPETPTQTTTADPVPEQVAEADVPERDLNGMIIYIGHWWDNFDTATAGVPENAVAEALLHARIAAQERYNFTVRERFVAPHNELQGVVANSIVTGDPVAHVVVLEDFMWGALANQGLFAPLHGVDFGDTSKVHWNQSVRNATMRNGVPHGFNYVTATGGGIYFNPLLLEEAGIDPELPFDMLMAGEWTWANFMDLLRQLNIDRDNNGVIDVHAISALPEWTLNLAVMSNDAPYVVADPVTGELINNTNTPEFFQAVQFVADFMNEGLIMPTPDGSPDWDWPIWAFQLGQSAMTVGFDWMSWQLQAMDHPIGFVPFPKGPNADTHLFPGSPTNIFSIPMTYADMVDDIMFAMSHWHALPEEFNDGLAWVPAAMSQFTHPRSVTDSLIHFNRNPELHRLPMHLFVPGLEMGPLLAWGFFDYELDVTAMIEGFQLQMNSFLADYNNAN